MTRPLLHRSITILGFAVLMFSLSAVRAKAAQNEAPATQSQAQAPLVSAEKNSFREVTSRLDTGGSLFLYLSTEQWLEGLSAKVTDWRHMVVSMPGLNAQDQANAAKAFDLISRVIKNCGIEEISGVGASAISPQKGLFHTKMLVHHYPGRNSGFLWSAFGRTSHPLDGLDLLPATTAYSCFADLDLPLLWGLLRQDIDQAGFPYASEWMKNFPAEFERNTGLKFDALLSSLGGTYGLVLTLDETRKISVVPTPAGGSMEFPEPGLMLAIKVKNDLIFDRFEQLMSQRTAYLHTEMIKTDREGLKMRTIQVGTPIPIPMRPSVARSGDYLFFASNDRLIEEALAVKGGKANGLKSTDEFKKLAQGIPTQGNSFNFISERLGRTASQLVQAFVQASAGNPAPRAELIRALLSQNQGAHAFAVSGITSEGWMTTGNGNQNPAKAFLVPLAVMPAAIMAGFTVPAVAKAKDKALSVQCVNNLKQIGLAGRIWALDHNDVLPKDFMSMTNELATPKILICPVDTSKVNVDVSGWATFHPANISYEMVSPGATETDPSKVFVRCPIHGLECHVDGSVQQARR